MWGNIYCNMLGYYCSDIQEMAKRAPACGAHILMNAEAAIQRLPSRNVFHFVSPDLLPENVRMKLPLENVAVVIKHHKLHLVI